MAQAEAVINGINIAVKAAPYIIDGIKYATEVGKKHKGRIDALNQLDKVITEKEKQVAELKGWFQANHVELPKEGAGILETIRDWVNRASEAWYKWREKPKLEKIAKLEGYRLILEATKKKILEAKNKAPASPAVPGTTGGAAMSHKLKHRMEGGELVVHTELKGGMRGGMRPGATNVMQNIDRFERGRTDLVNSARRQMTDGMDGVRSNPNYMGYMR